MLNHHRDEDPWPNGVNWADALRMLIAKGIEQQLREFALLGHNISHSYIL